MRRLIGSLAWLRNAACWGLLLVSWWGHVSTVNAVEEAGPALAVDGTDHEGPILVGYELASDESTDQPSKRYEATPVAEPAIDAAEPLPMPAAPRPATELKPVATAAAAPVVTDVIMLIDATHSMAWPSGRERRMAIALWSHPPEWRGIVEIATGLKGLAVIARAQL